MGMIADVVPNHMCITHPPNTLWWDVLENGPAVRIRDSLSDIECTAKEALVKQVLLRSGRSVRTVLENQELKVVYKEGIPLLFTTPAAPPPLSLGQILDPAIARLRDKLESSRRTSRELESIATALRHLPGTTETMMRKYARAA